MIGVNWQLGKNFPIPPEGLPLQLVVPDWARSLSQFPDSVVRNTALFRFMGGVDQVIALTPHGGHANWWCELPNGDRSYLIPEITRVRQARPDVVVHYGAEHPGGVVAAAVAALCDIVDVHKAIWDKPPSHSWTSELELTPASPEWSRVIPWCLSSRTPVFVWGAALDRADINDHAELIAALAALNTTARSVAMPDPVSPATVQAEEGLSSQAGYNLAKAVAILGAGNAEVIGLLYDGPQSAFGQLNAVDNARFPVPPRP